MRLPRLKHGNCVVPCAGDSDLQRRARLPIRCPLGYREVNLGKVETDRLSLVKSDIRSYVIREKLFQSKDPIEGSLQRAQYIVHFAKFRVAANIG